jgi:hypothetical protein
LLLKPFSALFNQKIIRNSPSVLKLYLVALGSCF